MNIETIKDILSYNDQYVINFQINRKTLTKKIAQADKEVVVKFDRYYNRHYVIEHHIGQFHSSQLELVVCNVLVKCANGKTYRAKTSDAETIFNFLKQFFNV